MVYHYIPLGGGGLSGGAIAGLVVGVVIVLLFLALMGLYIDKVRQVRDYQRQEDDITQGGLDNPLYGTTWNDNIQLEHRAQNFDNPFDLTGSSIKPTFDNY